MSGKAVGPGPGPISRASSVALLCLLAAVPVLSQARPEDRLDTTLKLLYQARLATPGLPSGLTPERSLDAFDRLLGVPPGRRATSRAVSGVERSLTLLVRYVGDEARLRKAGFNVQARLGSVYTGTLPVEGLPDLLRLPEVRFVQASRLLRATAASAWAMRGADSEEGRGTASRPLPQGMTGAGAVVAYIDTGVDIFHQDFRTAGGTTRIKFLLDLSDPGDVNDDGVLDGPGPFGGTLYTEADINAALAHSGTVNEKDTTGHGTHGLSIAAGDDPVFPGLAPEADLVVVKATREDGSLGFWSADLVNALAFVDEKAAELGKPYVVNLSLGTLLSSHDGRSLEEQAIDALVGPGVPGKAVVVAAGNSSDNRGSHFRHLSGRTFVGLETSHTLSVPAYTPNPGRGNDRVLLDLWYEGRDKQSLVVRAPASRPDCPEIAAAFGDVADFSTPCGDVFIANLGGPNPANGDIEAMVLVDDWSGTPPATGDWTIAVRGEEIGEAGTYHGWLAEDSQVGSVQPFLSANADNQYLVGKPGGAYHAITVGSYAHHDAATRYRTSWTDVNGGSRDDTTAVAGDISDFSSPGPTRDGRIKPELTAPGERTMGAVSGDAYPTTAPHSIYLYHRFPDPEALIVERTAEHAFGLAEGTSFSAPVVTGLAARVLSENPGLDAIQVRNVLMNAAVTDGFTGAVPNDVWGYGKVSQAVGGSPLPSDLRITVDALPGGAVDQPYNLVLTASGGTLPYTWAVSGGTLPPGLTLESRGFLTGVPTGEGAFDVTLQVTDASPAAQTDSRGYRVAISALRPLAVVTVALPSARIDKHYDAALEAEGGTPPYVWSFAGGALPGGLFFFANGLIQGSPDYLGRFNFTARVEDALGATALRSFRIRVLSPGGEDWDPLGKTTPMVNAIAVDPNDPNRVFVSTRNIDAVFETINAGDSWRATSINNNLNTYANRLGISPVDSVPWALAGSPGALPPHVFDRALDRWTPRPGGGTHAIDFDASDTVFTLSGPTLMRSDDLGLTWQALANTCGGWSNGLSIHRPDSRYMYALGASPDVTCLTEDGGVTWPDVTNLSGGGTDIRVSQQNPFDVVKAGSYAAWRSLDGGRNWTPSALRGSICCLDRSATTPSVVLAGTSEGVFKSSDGGQSWRESRIRSQILAVTSVAIDPSNSDNYYVGTDQGVFHSADGGITWALKNNGLIRRTLNAVVVSPAASSDVLIVATDGPYVSRTSGDAWTLSREGLTNYNNHHPAVSPADPNLYFVANDNGVFRSDNRGVTWYQPDPSFAAGFVVVAMDADPHDPNVVVASLSGTRGTYRSTNRGQTWAPVNTGLPFAEPTDLSFARDVAGRLYVAFKSKGVYRSEDRGTTWAPFGLNDITVGEVEPAPSNSGYLYARSGSMLYFRDPAGSGQFEAATESPARPINDIAVDPLDPTVAWAGADHSGVAGETGGVYKTTDGGRTWALLPGILDSFDVASLSTSPTTSGTVYAATLNAGVYRSTDGGLTWTELSNYGTVANLTNVTVQDPTNSLLLFAGTAGYGVQISTDRGKTFVPRVNGLTNFFVNAIAFDPEEPKVVYAATEVGIFRSTNSGANWGFTGQTTGQITDLVTDTEGAIKRIWGTVQGQGVAMSEDGGATFAVYSTGLASLELTSLEVEVRGSVRRIWGTTHGGDGVAYSDDMGRTWTPAAGNGLTDRNVNDLTIERGSTRRIWGTTDSGVFFSENDGLSWTELSAGLPSGVPVTSVVVDPNTSEVLVSLFSGEDGGVYRGGNLRGAWSPFNSGLDELKVRRLTRDPGHVIDAATVGTTYYAATAGDGVYVSEIQTPTGGTLAIVTTSLPDGLLRTDYEANLAEQGGTPPYSWSVAGGALPPGISLDAATGALRGQPGQAGLFSFTVQVSDSLSRADRKDLAIDVLSPDVPTLTIGDVSRLEGDTGSMPAVFTVSLSRTSDQTVTVGYATGDLTASAGVDYAAASGILTFAPGTTTKTVSVSIIGDTLAEPDETFFVNLSGASGATIATSQGIGTIRDDDSPPRLAIGDVAVLEGNTGTASAVFTVTLSRPVGFGVTVEFASVDGTATAPVDYQPASGPLTFIPGTTSQTVTVAVNGDTLVEPDETFLVTLANAVNATIDDGEGQATILDEDGIPALSVGDTTATEGAPNAVFAITLSTSSVGSVEVSYATSDGTAVAGTDYQATSGVVVFPPGERVRTIAVPLTVPDDTTDQEPRTFFLTLSQPEGATIADGQGTATILDNDIRLLSIDSPSVTEGGTAVFTVSLDAPSLRTISVDFTTVPGTATAGVDYQTTAGTSTFPPGTLTQSIVVPVSGNTIDEPNETFKVVLSNPVNARIATRQGPLSMTWTQLATPPFGPSHSQTKVNYDAATDRLMVLQTTVPAGPWVLENALANDATSRWHQLSPSGTPPVARDWAAVVYDPGSNRLVLHGGTTGGRETWVLTGANGLGAAQWIRLPDYPGNPRWQSAAAYDRAANRMIVFGGYVADVGWTMEVWVLKDANGLGSPQWVQLNPASAPRPRTTPSTSIVHDPLTNRLILFGGDGAPGTSTNPSGMDNDLWVLTHANGLGGLPVWTRLTPLGTPPGPRGYHAVAFDAQTNQMYLFGGLKGNFGSVIGNVAWGDTWLLMGANGAGEPLRWAPVPTTGPLARSSSSYTTGGDAALTVLQGYSANSGQINDLWTLADVPAGTATIRDDDPAPTVSVNDVAVTEGNSGLSSAVFTVSLANPSERPIEVGYGTADGSARSGPDYVATSGSVTVPAGASSATFAIPVKGDVFLESDETFFVNLTSASNASIGDGQGLGTILNDDVPGPDAPVPALQSIDPVAKAPGSVGFELRAFGANFVPTSVVRWNGADRATTFVSARELKAAIAALDVGTAGVARVSVFTPAPGGGRSEPLPFVVGATSSTVSFTRTDLSTGTGSRPIFVAAADLNGDGRADLVTANAEADSVSVFLGNGDGTFAPRVDYPAGDNPQWVHLADLDKDGDLDLAVANYSSSDVSVFSGTGDGTFAQRVDYAAGAGSLNAVVAGDFNADGLLDLAAGGTNGVSVLLRNGDGTYLSPGYVSASGAWSGTLVAGDFNGDAKLDLLAGTGSQVLLLTGNGEGVFSASVVAGYWCRMLAVPADVNRDGALDFVWAAYYGGSTTVTAMTGNNAGQFNGSAGFGAPSPYFPVVADFNGDGTVDVAVTNPSPASVSVSLGFGTPTEFATGQTPYGLAAADFNGDGRMDLVTANYGSDSVSILTSAPPPSLAIDDISVTEGNLGGKDTTFTLTLSSSTIATVTVNYATADGTARAGSDYVAKSGSLTFLPEETTKTVTVTIFGDTTYEPNETFFLNLGGINGALLADDQGRATIVNDDSGAILSVDDVTVPEGDSGSPVAAFTVSMPAPVPAGQSVTVSYTTADGTATAGSDYQATSGTLTFTQGQSAKVVSVPVIPDLFDELDETFTLNLSGASGAVIGDAQGVATIVDDDQATLSVGDVTVTEGNSGLTSATFTLSLSAPSAVPVVVAYATADNSARSGPDYVATSGSLTIPSGQTSATFGVAVKGDVFFEGDETFFVNVTSATNATIGDGQGQCTILNDDVPSADGPVPALQSIDPVSAAPGGSGFPLRLFGANFVPTSVVRWNGAARTTTFVSAREVRATILASDIAAAGVAQVSIFTPAPGGGSSGPLPFVVSQAFPSVSFTRSNLSTGTGSRPYFVAAADLNGDGRQDVVTANNGSDTVSVFLGNGDGTFRPRANYSTGDNPTWVHVADLDKDGNVDLIVANNASSDVSVLLGNGDGTFAPRVDYAAGVGSLHTVVAGDFNADGLLDLAAGGDGGVSVLLRNGDGSYLSPGYVSSSGTSYRMLGAGDFNGDAKLDLLASGAPLHLLTGNGEGVFSLATTLWCCADARGVAAELNRDGALDVLFIPYWGWSPGVSALFGDNVGGFPSSTGSPGLPSPYFPAVADFNADGILDSAWANINHASVSLVLASSVYTLGTPTEFAVGQSPYGAAVADFNGDGRMDLVTANYGSDTISLLTNAAPPSLGIGDISVSEGNLGGKDAIFTVTLSSSTIATVTVNYATADGTARAGSDYVAKSGSLTFLPGETTKTFTVTIFGDTTYEPDETFFVDLSALNGASLADGQARATIVNDDSGAILSVDDVTVPEGDSGSPLATFTVSMPAPVPAGQTVTVHYTTADGTATAGSDYQAVSGTLTFTQGQSSKVVSVPVIPDLFDELDETFTLNLSGASGAVIADAQGVATIVDDDQATLSVGDVTVTEGNSGLTNATFVLTLSAPSAVPVVAAYATADNSARSGPDYVATSSSGTIPSGQTSATIVVPVKGDVFFEGDETFFVNLTSVTNATVGDGQGQCTILNDDVPSADGPVPALQSIDPAAAAPGGSGFQLRLFGANLLPTSVVRWNGADRATTFVSAREVRATILAADVAAAGVAQVSVFTPAPGGGRSESLPFVISPPSSIVSFTRTSLSTGTGSRPIFVAAADINGDGRQDVVTANAESDNLSVFLGNGDGTFRARVSYPAGDYPRWVHVADLDKDGDPDLAVANYSSSDVSVFLGNGDGTFAPRVDCAAGVGNLYAVVAGDFNADGLTDLAAGGDGGVSVLLRNGDGTYLSPGYVSAAGSSVRMLATGDLNGDARLDLLAGTFQGVQVLAGNGEGVFTNTVVAGGCCDDWRVAPADFNHDGALDFVYMVVNWGGTSAMTGNNAGQFAGYAGFGAPSPYFPVVGDFNADGTVDVAVANVSHGSLSVSLGFGPVTTFAVGASPYGAAAADFNGDGRTDLATTNHGSDTVSVLMSAPPPSLGIGDVSVSEGNLGGKDATFTVTLSPSSIATVTVNYATTDGTAVAGSDYVAKSGSLTFQPGETTKTVAVTIFGDTAYEPDETFFLDLSGINGAVLADDRGQATVVNDDSGLLLSVGDVRVTEGNAGSPQAVFAVSMLVAVPAGQTVTVNYTTADGTASAGSDYQATSGTLTFTEGQSSRTVAVPLLPDSLDEPDEETFTLNLSNASGALIVDAQGVATIVDDDDVTLSVGDVFVTEGNGGLTNATFTASLSAPSARPIDLDYVTADDTARSGPDYVATSGRVSLPPGSTSASFSVPVRGDRFLEPDETFLVNLTATTGVILGAGQARGTILNDDVASTENPVPALHAIDPVSALPGSDGFELRVIGSNLLPTSVVLWNGTGRATTFVSARELRAAIPATDLLAAGVARVSVSSPSPGGGRSGPMPFVVSLPSAAISFTRADVPAGDGPSFVAADDLNGDGRADLVVADSEADTVAVLLGNGDGTFASPVAYAAGDGPGWLALADLDGDGDLDLAATNLLSGTVSVLLGNGTGGFAPRSDYDSGAQPSSVVAADFNADGKIDLAVGRASGQGVSVLLGNGDGTFLSPGYESGALAYEVSMLVPGEFTGDGRLDLLAGYQNGVQLLAGTGEGVFTVSQVAGGCCTTWPVAPADFNRDGALDFVFANYNGAANGVQVMWGNNAGGFGGGPGSPGMPSPYFPVVADFNADGVLDTVWTNRSHASVSLLLGAGYYGFQNPTGFATGSTPRGAAAADFNGDGRLDVAVANFDSDTLSILTNTPPPGLSVSDPSVVEGNSLTTDAVFTVTLFPPSVTTVTVNYATADGTATAGSDYVARSGSLTFLPGETTKSVAVTVFGDLTFEPDETFFLNLSGASGAEIADSQGRATILNDDRGFELSVSDVSVSEGGAGPAEAVFTVSMPVAVPAGETVSVAYSTADGTALAGLDYQAVGGTLTFAEGESSKTVQVPLLPDLLDEADESFFLDLSNPVGGLIVDGRGQATIVDDDPEPALSIGDVTVTEGASVTHALFTVALSAPSGRPVSLSYATADGTALAGTDYLPASGTLVFEPGMTARSVSVTVIGDRVAEADETFFVNLSLPTHAVIGDGQGQGTIRDDDTLVKAEITDPLPGSALPAGTVSFTWSPGVGASRYWLSVGTTPGGTQIYHADQGQALSRAVTGLPTDGTPVHVRLWTLLDTEWSFGDYVYSTGGVARGFYTVTPCRLVDTRSPAGPLGGPALVAGVDRTFTLVGQCDLPPAATSVSLNITVAQATTGGNLTLFPGGTAPSASAINYAAGQTRANNGIFRLSATGGLVVRCRQSTGTADLILDVNGYFVE